MLSHYSVMRGMLAPMDDVEKKREALRRYMAANGLKASPWALAAGLSVNSISRYLSGANDSLSDQSWQKLADERGVSVLKLRADVNSYAGLDVGGENEDGEADERSRIIREIIGLFDSSPPNVQDALLTLLRFTAERSPATRNAASRKDRS